MQTEIEKTPRRARLFELLRQGNQAKTTDARLRRNGVKSMSAAEVADLQRAAMKSLQTRPEGRVRPETL